MQKCAALTRRLPIVPLLYVFSVFLLFVASRTDADHDMYHELCLAREIVAIGHIPVNDTLAYTDTVSPVVHHEWGTGLVLYAILVLFGGGAIALMAFKYLLAFATAGLTWMASTRQGGGRMTVLLCPFAFFVGYSGFSTLRAQVFTLLMISMLMLLLSYDRGGSRRWILVWLPFYVLWLNLHGGFLAGVGILGLHLVERVVCIYAETRSLRECWSKTRHLFFAGAAMAVLWVINPYGIQYGHYLLGAIALKRDLIAEWGPLWTLGQPGVYVVYALMLVLVVYAAIQNGVHRFPGLLFLAFTAVEALLHIRHLPIFAVVWLAQLPPALQRTRLGNDLTTLRHRFSRLARVVMLCITAGALVEACQMQFWKLRLPYKDQDELVLYPTGAVEYLRLQQFSGNLMVPFECGGYVAWKLYPRVRISVDSRYEVAYPPEWIEEVYHLYWAGDGWEEILRAHPTDAVLVRCDAALNSALMGNPLWRHVYGDGVFNVYARHGSSLSAELLQVPIPERQFP